MGNIDIDIFDNTLETTKELYENRAKELNEKEFNFRTIKRQKLYPNWKISRKEKRKWITLGGFFYLNNTMYEMLGSNSKLKRFIYYHDEKLKEISKCKYELDNLNLSIHLYLDNS
ncbi:hypothetical protein [Metamycoplasma auris]|uniref:Uncharacterized protein n=1 Tax=Metamycoplasma auris TaxID=51363 RepID=A0A2W7HXH1_9BACT|nr:hypothetical protein [Metamycoplasma auris]PZV99895.1 hypothetical protein BCF89_10524 [Metamycoplasma auris]